MSTSTVTIPAKELPETRKQSRNPNGRRRIELAFIGKYIEIERKREINAYIKSEIPV